MSINPPEQSKSSKAQQIAGEWQDPEQIQRQIQAQKDERPAIPAFVAPRTPMEVKLAEIWANVLGLERVGVHDNFFELGGNSLQATQILSQASHAFRVELPPDLLLLDKFTVAELVQAIARHKLKNVDQTEMAELLHKVSALPEDQVRALLAAKKK